jgi:hypothetical protein
VQFLKSLFCDLIPSLMWWVTIGISWILHQYTASPTESDGHEQETAVVHPFIYKVIGINWKLEQCTLFSVRAIGLRTLHQCTVWTRNCSSIHLHLCGNWHQLEPSNNWLFILDCQHQGVHHTSLIPWTFEHFMCHSVTHCYCGIGLANILVYQKDSGVEGSWTSCW